MILSWYESIINHIGTEKGPNFYGGQQWGILGNELIFDPAILYMMLRPQVENYYSA